jgi:hypothetical protein
MRRALLLLLSAGWLSQAHADFKDAYKDGVRAADDKNWALVESKMREALSQEPNPQAKVRLYGMRFEPYLPHHYLALAANARGNCAAALAAIGNSAHQSALTAARDAANLQNTERAIQKRCQNTTAPAPTVPIAPPAAPVAVPAQPAPLVQTPRTPTANPAAAPSLASNDVAQARSAVQLLKRELSAARGALAKPEIAALAANKSGELSALDSESTRLGADVERAVNAVDAALLARSASAARDASARAARLKVAALSAVAAAAPVARTPPPAVLAQLAKLYFNGDFKAAATLNVEALNGKALAHALLLRASARYSLYVSQGETKPEQLSAVKEDLARAKRTDASVRPSVKYFSPRLLALY